MDSHCISYMGSFPCNLGIWNIRNPLNPRTRSLERSYLRVLLMIGAIPLHLFWQLKVHLTLFSKNHSKLLMKISYHSIFLKAGVTEKHITSVRTDNQIVNTLIFSALMASIKCKMSWPLTIFPLRPSQWNRYLIFIIFIEIFKYWSLRFFNLGIYHFRFLLRGLYNLLMNDCRFLSCLSPSGSSLLLNFLC